MYTQSNLNRARAHAPTQTNSHAHTHCTLTQLLLFSNEVSDQWHSFKSLSFLKEVIIIIYLYCLSSSSPFHTYFSLFFNSLRPLMSTLSLSSFILTFCFSEEQIDFLLSSSTEASLKAVQPLCCFGVQHTLTGRHPGRQMALADMNEYKQIFETSLWTTTYRLLFFHLWSFLQCLPH